MTWRRVCAVVASLLSLPATAAAQRARADEHQPPAVRLDLDPCVGVAQEEVRRVVAVELDARLAEVRGGDMSTTRVTASCADDGTVVLRVDDPLTGKTVTRAVRLRDADASAQGRLLALAIAELVVASWTELEITPNPALPPATPPDAAAQDAARAVARRRLRAPRVPSPPPPPPAWSLGALGTLRYAATSAGGLVLAGVGLRGGSDLTPWLAWSAEVFWESGARRTPSVVVAAESTTVGAALWLRHAWPWLELRGGLTLRGGIASLAASDPAPGSVAGSPVVGPWAGAALVAGLSVRPWPSFSLDLNGEAGETFYGVSATAAGGGTTGLVLDGPWCAGLLGASVHW